MVRYFWLLLTCSYMSSAQTPTVDAKPYDWVPVWDSVVTVNAPSSSTPVDPDLVAFWKYNEASGPTAASEVNGYTLTAAGNAGNPTGVPPIVTGVEGNARGGNLSMFRLLSASECNALRGEITVDAYVYSTSIGSANQGFFVIDPQPSAGQRNEVFAVYMSSAGIYSEYLAFNGARMNYQSPGAGFIANTWSRITSVRKSVGVDTYQIRQYSQGALVGVSSTFPAGSGVTPCQINQGINTGVGSLGFSMFAYPDGIIDYVRVWKRALSDAEISVAPLVYIPSKTLSCGDHLRNITVSSPIAPGMHYNFTCPTGCNVGYGAVYGTAIYTDDSSVCASGIHDGRITAAAGGVVHVATQAGAASYTATTQNGITSMAFGAWNNAFHFE